MRGVVVDPEPAPPRGRVRAQPRVWCRRPIGRGRQRWCPRRRGLRGSRCGPATTRCARPRCRGRSPVPRPGEPVQQRHRVGGVGDQGGGLRRGEGDAQRAEQVQRGEPCGGGLAVLRRGRGDDDLITTPLCADGDRQGHRDDGRVVQMRDRSARGGGAEPLAEVVPVGGHDRPSTVLLSVSRRECRCCPSRRGGRLRRPRWLAVWSAAIRWAWSRSSPVPARSLAA